MTDRPHPLPPWLDDERALLSYLIRRHGAHPYGEDLIDALALVTSWVMVAASFLAVVGVVLDTLL